MALKTMVSLSKLIPRVMADSITGAYKSTPFFKVPTGEPAVPVTVLSEAERARAYQEA
jgi:hypothetical protein